MKRKLEGFSKGKIVFYSNLIDIVIAKVYDMKGEKIYVTRIDTGKYECWAHWIEKIGKPYNLSKLYRTLSRYNDEERHIDVAYIATSHSPIVRITLSPKK